MMSSLRLIERLTAGTWEVVRMVWLKRGEVFRMDGESQAWQALGDAYMVGDIAAVDAQPATLTTIKESMADSE